MSTNKIISQLEAEQMDKEVPEFGPGDTVVVQVKESPGLRSGIAPSSQPTGPSLSSVRVTSTGEPSDAAVWLTVYV